MSAPATKINTNMWSPDGDWIGNYHAPEWFQQTQTAAVEAYRKVGLPGVRDEEWRYTRLNELYKQNLNWAKPGGMITALKPGHFTRWVFVDGFFSRELSNQTNLPEGVTLAPLATALDDDAFSLKEYWGSTLPQKKHGFLHLNTGYCADGYVLHLSKNTVLEAPLEVVFLSNKDVACQARNIIVAEASSQCTVIERHQATHDGDYLSNSVTEIIARRNARVNHCKLLQGGIAGTHIGGVYIKQARDSQVKNHLMSLSGKLLRNQIYGDLVGPGAHLEMNGLILGDGRQHIDNHTEINHRVPHCSSDELYKAIVDDRARSIFRGRIVVAEDAQQTKADQQNKSLLLSQQAEADSKPQLEIYADDVKCSHGATVGQLDAKSLYYLQSRGIEPASAKALLTFAFANEVIERVQVEQIKAELRSILAGELADETGKVS